MTVLNIPFLGARTYIQGPSILEALWPQIPSGASVKFKVRRLLRSDRVRVVAAGELNDPSFGELLWVHGSESGELHLYPEPASPEPARLPFNEDAIWGRVSLDEKVARIADCGPHRLPTIVTSLNKLLLTRVWPISDPGQWVFVGISLEGGLPSPGPIEVRVENIIRPVKMARSSIKICGAQAGSLDFGWRDIRRE